MSRFFRYKRYLRFLPQKIWCKLFYSKKIVFRGRELLDTNVSLKVNGVNAKLEVGREVRVETGTLLDCENGKIILGDRVFINRNTMVVSMCKITIEDDVTIGPGVYIYDHDHDMQKRGSFVSLPVVIGKGAWIGAGSVLLKGISIGANAVVAAGSIVTKDIPENAIVAGNPAKILKYKL